nr:MAG TPA: FmdE, Molybdenum formylmethanofuran dehydrogenase operon [Caudoviricetes sp.]
MRKAIKKNGFSQHGLFVFHGHLCSAVGRNIGGICFKEKAKS